MQNFSEDVVAGRHGSRWRSVGVVLIAGACFGAYWGWLGWDQTYQRDPVTGVASGPYEPWQVVGCVLSLALVAVVAGLVRQAAVAKPRNGPRRTNPWRSTGGRWAHRTRVHTVTRTSAMPEVGR